MKIILASKSPRRRELLGAYLSPLCREAEIIVREVDEELYGEPPLSGVATLAVRKGAAVYREHPEALVVSSDTLVELDGVPLGKPTNAEDAVRMLKSLSGRWHNVHTGIAIHFLGRAYFGTATTRVRFRTLTDGEIRAYVSTGEPMDKAGAYGIQGKGGALVECYDGDFDTVVGFSTRLFQSLLRDAGVEL